MNPRELIIRITDLEARVAELEGAVKALEESSGKAEAMKEIETRLQAMEGWRRTFEGPVRERLQIKRPTSYGEEIDAFRSGSLAGAPAFDKQKLK